MISLFGSKDQIKRWDGIYCHHPKFISYDIDLNKELVKFVVELSQLPLSEKDHKYVSTAFHTINDLERMGAMPNISYQP